MEILAQVYDHVTHRYHILSSSKQRTDIRRFLIRLTTVPIGYKARKERLLSSLEAAILLNQRALHSGIQIDYMVMSTMFTAEPMLIKALQCGIDKIGMLSS